MKNQRVACFASLAIVMAVAGCASTETTSKGAGVEIVTERPTGCRLLGEAVGKQGNAVTGVFIYNDNLMIGARNDLRNKAAAMGGNVVQAQSTLNGTHPYSSGAISSTVIGNVYACPGK